MDKKTLRQEMRQRRRELTPLQQRQAAAGLCRLLKRQPAFVRSKHIAFYLPNDGEVSPLPLLQAALMMKKCCYLPVLAPGNQLWFYRYHNSTHLKLNRFGIAEPNIIRSTRFPAKHLDMILLPLVAFDQQGGRLGMGGGFYDRTLAFKNKHHNSHKPLLLGLAHACQETEALSLEAWDIPLDGIVTDKALLMDNPSQRDLTI